MRFFASHAWGANNMTHRRVATVVTDLRAAGHSVWFDETDMKGNLLDAMCRGIDECDFFLVFVTQGYIEKVRRGNASDNVRREFMYASQHCPNRMVAIKFDSQLPRTWGGPVGMLMGAELYADLSASTLTSSERVSRITSVLSTSGSPRLANVAANVLKRQAAPCGKLRARFQKICDAVGEVHCTDDHIGAHLDRLFESIVGERPDGVFVTKLERLERETGVASSS